MSLNSYLADQVTQAEIDYRRERALQQFARRSHRGHRGRRWPLGKQVIDHSDR